MGPGASVSDSLIRSDHPATTIIVLDDHTSKAPGAATQGGESGLE